MKEIDNREITFAETTRLVASAQNGSSECVEQLFQRYLPRVRQMVALRVGRRLAELESCEDLVQETLLEAFRNLEEFEHRTIGSFRNWLAMIATNRVRGRARREATLKRGSGNERRFSDYESRVLTDSVFAGREVSPLESAAESELAARIEAAMLELAEPDRRVIELRRIAEMSFEEIAAELNLGSEASARAQFARSLRRLDTQLNL